MWQFRNDYSEGAIPEILDALLASNLEQCKGYTEDDPYSEAVRSLIKKLCGQEVLVEFCFGGTSANKIMLASLTREWEGIICAHDAHISIHETGAIEETGRSVLATTDELGKLTPEGAEAVYQRYIASGRHSQKPGAIYLSNATELGEFYTKAELSALSTWAHARNLKLALDGARLASALCAEGSDLSIKDLVELCDVFTIGATKAGALFGELIVSKDPDFKKAFPYQQKRLGGLMAKGRLLGLQLLTLLEQKEGQEPLYVSYAKNANHCAALIYEGLKSQGYELVGSGKTNQIFAWFDAHKATQISAETGAELIEDQGDKQLLRFVCSWACDEEKVQDLLAFISKL